MKFAKGDYIHHRSATYIKGVVVEARPNQSRYLVHWLDYGTEGVQTQEFIEENYELAVASGG